MTLNALDEYVNPVPAVVVAPEYTNPFGSNANPPEESDGRKRSDEMVDEAVEKKPLSNPRVEVVDIP